MAAAGLLFGLSVGARPNYLASFAVLLIPAVPLAQREAGGLAARARAFGRAVFWTFLADAAQCGTGLLWLQLGAPRLRRGVWMHYQLAGERVTAPRMMAPGFLPPHVGLVPLPHGGALVVLFSLFFRNIGQQPFGLARYVPWTPARVAAFFFPTVRGAPGGSGTSAGRWVLVLAGALALNLAFLACFFFGTTGRYLGAISTRGAHPRGRGALVFGQRAASMGRGWPGNLSRAGLLALVSLGVLLRRLHRVVSLS